MNGEHHVTLDAARLNVYLLCLPLKEMEAEVNRVLRGGSSHDVLSEGFGLRLTRKDLQTLSNLNWLNDEVSAPKLKVYQSYGACTDRTTEPT